MKVKANLRNFDLITKSKRLLFERYPEIETAYLHAVNLNYVFRAKSRETAPTRPAKWYEQVEKYKIGALATVAKIIMNNYRTI